MNKASQIEAYEMRGFYDQLLGDVFTHHQEYKQQAIQQQQENKTAIQRLYTELIIKNAQFTPEVLTELVGHIDSFMHDKLMHMRGTPLMFPFLPADESTDWFVELWQHMRRAYYPYPEHNPHHCGWQLIDETETGASAYITSCKQTTAKIYYGSDMLPHDTTPEQWGMKYCFNCGKPIMSFDQAIDLSHIFHPDSDDE